MSEDMKLTKISYDKLTNNTNTHFMSTKNHK